MAAPRLRAPYAQGNEDVASILAINNALSGYFRNPESKRYRSGRDWPQVCLALSGGGMRAAAFGIGVLSGAAFDRPHEIGSIERLAYLKLGFRVGALATHFQSSGADEKPAVHSCAVRRIQGFSSPDDETQSVVGLLRLDRASELSAPFRGSKILVGIIGRTAY
jgi:hypothetical protein